ncbi:Uncharacterised protein g357 [Pycnogonum litorale]
MEESKIGNRSVIFDIEITTRPIDATADADGGVTDGRLGDVNGTDDPDLLMSWKSNLYRTTIPMMLTVCTISVLFNLTILLSMNWVKRSSSPTLHLSVSLAVADAYSSLVIGLGLLINSLLPYGYGIHLGSGCHTMILEAFRLAGPIISVLHLLALAINHYVGILRPLHYASVVTRRKAFVVIAFIWILPFLYVFSYFSSISDQGFRSTDCMRYDFLTFRTFRIVFSLIFFLPLFVMAFIYCHIFFIIRRHHDEAGQKDNHLKKNVKAIVTTLLILGTYVLGWMPAVVIYVTFCSNCVYPPSFIPTRVFIIINIIINSLIILKSSIDSLVYAIRNREIHRALANMINTICCRKVQTLESRQSFYMSANSKYGSAYERVVAKNSLYVNAYRSGQNSKRRNGNNCNGGGDDDSKFL